MNTIPKVLFLNPWGRFIGPNRYLLEMLRGAPALARAAIVAFHERNEALREFEDLGCRVIIVPEIAQLRARFTLLNIFAILWRHTAGLGRVLRMARLVRPDIIVSNTEQLIAGGIVSRLLGLPHVKIFHAMTFAYRLGNRPILLKTYLFIMTLWTDIVVSVSETLRQALLAGGLDASRLTTVPNPLPVAYLRSASALPLPPEIEERLSRHRPIIVSAGVIFPKKGQDQLLEALPAIRKLYPRVLCLFAGRVGEASGIENTVSYFDSLQSRIPELGLEENIMFLGEIDYLPALMHRANIYVQTSRTESFCRTVAEALACGTPVVAFDAGAIREVAGPGALLVRQGYIPGLAHAMAEVLTDRDRANEMVLNGGKHVEENYDAERIGRSFLEFLVSLNGSTRP